MKVKLLIFLLIMVSGLFCNEKVLFKGLGTEPFWDIKVTETMIYFNSYDSDSLKFTYNSITHAIGYPDDYYYQFMLFRGEVFSGILVINKQGECKCSDSMSDFLYEYGLILILENITYIGCASGSN